MKRIEISIAVGLICSVMLFSFSEFARECDEVRNGVVRLHILANSDGEEDQRLKLAVRDAVLTGTDGLFEGVVTREQAEAAAAARLDEIKAIAQSEILRKGYNYNVQARIVNRFFETRIYDGFTLPAGRYDAVQLEIGAGNGKNWWCVMYPPMCVPAASKDNGLPLEEQIRELGRAPVYKPAFAVVEAIESLKEKLSATEEEKIESVLQ